MTFSEDYWKLTSRIIREVATIAQDNGARLAILSDSEEGRFQWDRYWFRVVDSDKARARYFRINTYLSDSVDGMPVDLIPSKHPHERAINDSHVNESGNEAIARNLHAYIINNFGNMLKRREE